MPELGLELHDGRGSMIKKATRTQGIMTELVDGCEARATKQASLSHLASADEIGRIYVTIARLAALIPAPRLQDVRR